MTLEDAVKKMLPCPFCRCSMGIVYISGSYRWTGYHKSFCPISENPSHWYHKVEGLLDEWNKRSKKGK